MDRQKSFVSEHKDDHLEQVAGEIRTDRQLPWRIAVRIDIDDDECVVRGVAYRIVIDAMSASRPVDLHTLLV